MDESGASAGAATDPDGGPPAEAESPMDTVDDWGATSETPPGAVDQPEAAEQPAATETDDASASDGMDAPSDAVNGEQKPSGGDAS